MYDQRKGYADIALDKIAFTRWIQAANNAPNQGRRHALNMMGMALREELSEKQLRCITAYYVEQLNMVEIGAKYGINKATVSRTIKRGLTKLKKVLRYSSPILLKESFGETAVQRCRNGAGRRSASHG